MKMVDDVIDHLVNECKSELSKQGFPTEKIKTDIYLNLRYNRTDCGIMCLPASNSNSKQKQSKHGDFLTTFQQRYELNFINNAPNLKYF